MGERARHVPEKARRYWLAGQWLRFNTVHFRTVVPRRSCGFGHRNVAVVLGFGCRRSLSRSSDDSNAVAFAGAPTRLSAHAGRASLHHRFVSARIVSARRTSALAKAVAQLQVERTGRQHRATLNRRPGPPHTKTLIWLSVSTESTSPADMAFFVNGVEQSRPTKYCE